MNLLREVGWLNIDCSLLSSVIASTLSDDQIATVGSELSCAVQHMATVLKTMRPENLGSGRVRVQKQSDTQHH